MQCSKSDMMMARLIYEVLVHDIFDLFGLFFHKVRPDFLESLLVFSFLPFMAALTALLI